MTSPPPASVAVSSSARLPVTSAERASSSASPGGLGVCTAELSLTSLRIFSRVRQSAGESVALDAGEGGNGCSAGEDMSSAVESDLRFATGVVCDVSAGWLSRAMVLWDGCVCVGQEWR
jgi:hypothetical protein